MGSPLCTNRMCWTSVLLTAPLVLLAGALLNGCVLLPFFCGDLAAANPTVGIVFGREGVALLVRTLSVCCGIVGALMFLTALAGTRPRPKVLPCIRFCSTLSYVLAVFYGYAVMRVSGLLYTHELAVDGVTLDSLGLFRTRFLFLAPAAILTALAALLHVCSWRRMVIALFTGHYDERPAAGDRILEGLRTHGPDPQYRKSVYSSVLAHTMVIVVLPWLLQFVGCVEPYRIPKGSGNPVLALVKIVKPKKKRDKQFVLRPNAAIYFHIPDLDESEILEAVERESENTYGADPNSKAGKMGDGGPGGGGWPDGMDRAVVRFVRLQYSGRNWDDGMDSRTRADINFLEEFHELTGFKVADHSESHPVRYLEKYRPGTAPPFVYMTGDGSINFPSRDLRVLRDYLLEGGTLFADCGSPQWDRAFRSFATALFPGGQLRVVADDDPIFQFPFVFPHGAPPLWHHGGRQVCGIKHGGRWVVLYHPGDVNDAWKTGHSGLRPKLAQSAYLLGVNIVYHAFANYLEATKRHRK